MAFRVDYVKDRRTTGRLAVVDLDEAYLPQGPATVFDPATFPPGVISFEDPRLLSRRGKLHLQVDGLLRHLVRLLHSWLACLSLS